MAKQLPFPAGEDMPALDAGEDPALTLRRLAEGFGVAFDGLSLILRAGEGAELDDSPTSQKECDARKAMLAKSVADAKGAMACILDDCHRMLRVKSACGGQPRPEEIFEKMQAQISPICKSLFSYLSDECGPPLSRSDAGESEGQAREQGGSEALVQRLSEAEEGCLRLQSKNERLGDELTQLRADSASKDEAISNYETQIKMLSAQIVLILSQRGAEK